MAPQAEIAGTVYRQRSNERMYKSSVAKRSENWIIRSDMVMARETPGRLVSYMRLPTCTIETFTVALSPSSSLLRLPLKLRRFIFMQVVAFSAPHALVDILFHHQRLPRHSTIQSERSARFPSTILPSTAVAVFVQQSHPSLLVREQRGGYARLSEGF